MMTSNPRHEFYQTDNQVIISIFIKGATKTEIDFQEKAVSLSVKLDATREFQLDFDPLCEAIDPSSSSYCTLSTKIEIKLAKKVAGKRWTQLVGASDDVAIIMANPDQAANISHTYPSSSKKKADWNKIEKTMEEEKVEGEQVFFNPKK
jgi:suppressor of G2 allele of SKP1